MLDVLYIFGEVLLILSLIGFIGVMVWVVMTALHVKNTTVAHAKRLSERPIKASKNLVTTVKGIAQQETIRVKHIGASVKEAAGAVQEAASEIKGTAQAVHPEDLKPALASLQNITKVLRLAAQFTEAAAKQSSR